NRATIYGSIRRMEQEGVIVSAPEVLLGDYLCWKRATEESLSISTLRKNLKYTTLLYNWSFCYLVNFQVNFEFRAHRTRFLKVRLRYLAYWSRAPPAIRLTPQ